VGYSGGGSLGDVWALGAADRSPYHEHALIDPTLAAVELRLGVRLPRTYVAMARAHNGGLLARTAFHTTSPTTWAPDHIAVTGIFAIGDTAPYSLCGAFGQGHWLQEWGYPNIGVYFADTPSAGRDLLALDYRECGPDGEPSVVHVDQEAGYVVTYLAATFEAFLTGLVGEPGYDS
jgi:hypothetical protein